jgi:photosystem II stability/assembly factor-like uncharacterized protein
MAKSKTKPKALSPRPAQSPQRAASAREGPSHLLWLAAASPLILAVAILAIWLPSRGNDSSTSAPAAGAEASTAASLPDTPDYHSLLIDQQDPDHLWLGTHYGLYSSTDGGHSWSEAGLSGLDAMNLGRSRSRTVWAAGHMMFAKSTDGGASWSNVVPKGLPTLDIHGFTVDPRNPRHLFAAVAGQGLYQSTDAAATFSLVSKSVGPAVMALAIAPDGRILAGDMQQGLLMSRNGGSSWTGVLSEGLMGLTINPKRPTRMLATSSSGVSLSTDGGSSWRVVQPVPDGAGPVAWAPSRPKVAYAVGFDRVLYKSMNGGASWRPVS